MSDILKGVIAGFIFGIVSIIPMIFMKFENKLLFIFLVRSQINRRNYLLRKDKAGEAGKTHPDPGPMRRRNSWSSAPDRPLRPAQGRSQSACTEHSIVQGCSI